MLDTGGPAYPLTMDAISHKARGFCMQGMTLLDCFAGQAMAGLLTEQWEHTWDHSIVDSDPDHCRDLASRAYEIAQAMIREKRRLEAEGKDQP